MLLLYSFVMSACVEADEANCCHCCSAQCFIVLPVCCLHIFVVPFYFCSQVVLESQVCLQKDCAEIVSTV